MAGKNKRSNNKQAPPPSSNSAATSLAGHQKLPSIESNTMAIGDTGRRDGKREGEAFGSNAFGSNAFGSNAYGYQDLGHQFQNLNIGTGFSGPAKYHSTNALSTPPFSPVTPPFSPLMLSNVGPPSMLPLYGAPSLYPRDLAYHKNTPATQSSVSALPPYISATSPAYYQRIPSTQSPVSTLGFYASASPQAPIRTWIVYRPDKFKKNVIITAFGIKHNIAQFQGVIHADGSRDQFETNKYKQGHYDFLADMSSLSVPERRNFWARNVVEINIDIKALDSAIDPNYPTILTQMDKLDDSFYQHVAQIYINLNYSTPQTNPGPAINQHRGRPEPVPLLRDTPPIEVNTPAMRLLTRLICRLTKLKSLTQLAVTMKTPLTSGASITCEQLDYVVPFMILEDWSLYSQAVYLRTPQLIPHECWAIRYLGEQWFKVHDDFKEMWVAVRREYDAEFPGRVRGLDGTWQRRAWD